MKLRLEMKLGNGGPEKCFFKRSKLKWSRKKKTWSAKTIIEVKQGREEEISMEQASPHQSLELGFWKTFFLTTFDRL